MGEPSRDYVRQRACLCGPAPEACVADDEVLTQHGMADVDGEVIFTSEPRMDREREVSLMRGRFTAEKAVKQRWSRVSSAKIARSRVRYTTAGALRGVGLAVVHTPAERIADDSHVSVVWPPDHPVERQDIPWPQPVADRFDKCFDGDDYST